MNIDQHDIKSTKVNLSGIEPEPSDSMNNSFNATLDV